MDDPVTKETLMTALELRPTCIRVRQETPESADDAIAHIRLATQHLEAATVTISLISGLPGTGRSTLAAGVADRTGAVVISSYVVRKELAGLEPRDPHPAPLYEGLYTPSITDHTYAEMLRRARTELSAASTDPSRQPSKHRLVRFADLSVQRLDRRLFREISRAPKPVEHPNQETTMRTLIVHESMYGNTREIAEAIAQGIRAEDIGERSEVDVVPATHASECDIGTYDLLVVGGPTHVHGMSRQRSRDGAIAAASQPDATLQLEAQAAGPGIREWFDTLDYATGAAAAFDTRMDRSPLLTGRASKTIAKRLRRLGSSLVCEPESFLVDKNTQLLPGEKTRAEEWGRSMRKGVSSATS